MTDQPSVWRPLVDAWAEREARIRRDASIRTDSIAIRDAIEVGDSAYVLVSFEVDHPWPAEEGDAGSGQDTVVLQAIRAREPWIERDATRSLSQARSDDGRVTMHDHLVGRQRVISGHVDDETSTIELQVSTGDPARARVVDGWFMAVLEAGARVNGISGLDGDTQTWTAGVERQDVDDLIDSYDFTRRAGRSMYFSPLDLRKVIPLIQWERSGNVAVVATCLERYDEGGILRLRIDGVRPDDDILQTWPTVQVRAGGEQVGSAVTSESYNADTIAIDVGFSPWVGEKLTELEVIVSDLRTEGGRVDSVALTLRLDGVRDQ